MDDWEKEVKAPNTCTFNLASYPGSKPVYEATFIPGTYIASSTDSAIVLIFIAYTIALAKHRDNTLYLGKNSDQYVGPAELK